MIQWPLLIIVAASQPTQVGGPYMGLGTRVRVTTNTSSQKPVVGQLSGMDSGRVAIRVTTAGTVVSIPRSNVSDVSVSLGRARGAGVLRGWLVGLGVGAVIFAVTLDEVRQDQTGIELVLAPIAYFGLLPIPFAISGALLAEERWRSAGEVGAPSTFGTAPAGVQFAPLERVRVVTSSGTHTGRVYSSTVEMLTLDEGQAHLAWRDLRSVEVRAGKNRVQGALIGTAVGLAISIAAQSGSPIPDASAAAGAFALTMTGGAILGSQLLAGKRWVSLPISP